MWCKTDRSVLLASGAVLAVGLVGTWLVASRSGDRSPGDDLVEVLVVGKDLPVRTLMDESAMQAHIGRGRVRRDQLPANAVGDERLLLGKRTLRNLRAGEFLIDTDVGHPIICSFPDIRAYCVQLGSDGRRADAVRPGDRVDLFVGVRVDRGRVASEPVVMGLIVLSASTADELDRVLYVAVNPAQGDAIRAAEYRGDLQAVRSARAEWNPLWLQENR